ncbi:MAG: hypothetical protein ACRDFR_03335 [Candidatus Limnocylindria bacterium]
MSRGRPRHQGSRRRAYSVRQREVRERRLRLAHDDADWRVDGMTADDPEPSNEADQPVWILGLDGRASAA